MYEDIYVYPAIITKFDDKDYNVSFPDFEEIVTYGESLEEAYIMAEDALKLCVFDSYVDGEKLPEATSIQSIKVDENQVMVLIKTNIKQLMREYDNKAVKKTLTIPSWLNKEAEKAHINFSQLLKEALINYLDLNN